MWEGGQPRTQLADSTFTCSTFMEKSMDNRSNGCLCQQDIQQFYDTQKLTLAADFLIEQGCDDALVGSILRHQLLPNLVFTHKQEAAVITDRCIGSLTRSPLAAQCGRIPVLQSISVILEAL